MSNSRHSVAELRRTLRHLAKAEDALTAARYDVSVARYDVSVALARAVSAHLAEKRITQTEFAKRHRVSKAFVTDVLHHRRYSPALAKALTTGGADV